MGPPSSSSSHTPSQVGSSAREAWSKRANCTRASFIQREDNTSVWAADTNQSRRSSAAPAVRATVPPKASAFSSSRRNTLPRRVSVLRGLHWCSTLASICVESTA